MVKSIAQKLQRSLLRSFKLLLVIVLFLLFYVLFSLTEPELLRFSRTAAITLICFPVMCVLMLKIYGGFPIGIKKTKEIVYSAAIATFLADAVTYLELAIMRINFVNRSYVQDFFTLVGIFLLQVIAINLFGYLGNYLYFTVNPPQNVWCFLEARKGCPSLSARSPVIRNSSRSARSAISLRCRKISCGRRSVPTTRSSFMRSAKMIRPECWNTAISIIVLPT